MQACNEAAFANQQYASFQLIHNETLDDTLLSLLRMHSSFGSAWIYFDRATRQESSGRSV